MKDDGNILIPMIFDTPQELSPVRKRMIDVYKQVFGALLILKLEISRDFIDFPDLIL